jgi:hypothetical protein
MTDLRGKAVLVTGAKEVGEVVAEIRKSGGKPTRSRSISPRRQLAFGVDAHEPEVIRPELARRNKRCAKMWGADHRIDSWIP